MKRYKAIHSVFIWQQTVFDGNYLYFTIYLIIHLLECMIQKISEWMGNKMTMIVLLMLLGVKHYWRVDQLFILGEGSEQHYENSPWSTSKKIVALKMQKNRENTCSNITVGSIIIYTRRGAVSKNWNQEKNITLWKFYSHEVY